MSDKNGREFMGLTIEGDHYGWARTPQEPIENLYAVLKEAFELKGVKGIMWEQYTPGWNDGEPCEFSIRDPKVTTNEAVAQAWLDGDEPDMSTAYPEEDYDAYGYDEYEYEQWGEHPDGKHVKDISIPVNHGQFEDALREKFGNDVKVIVALGRVVTEEYDCGY